MSFGYNYAPDSDSCINETPPVITITADGKSTFGVEYTHEKVEEDDSSSSSSMDWRRRRRDAGCNKEGMVVFDINNPLIIFR